MVTLKVYIYKNIYIYTLLMHKVKKFKDKNKQNNFLFVA